jgi:hypothetical protein
MFNEIIQNFDDVTEVWPQKLLSGNLGEFRGLSSTLNLSWEGKKIADFVAPLLWSNGVFKSNVGEEDG